jgi:hypothetical protein
MGCDIHLYIEYKSKKTEFDGYDSGWQSFGGSINPGRNYAMFALMADVRNYGDDKLPVLVKRRGMPEDAGYTATDDIRIYISDVPSSRYVSTETAKSWVKSGSSKVINDKEGNPMWVTDPDAHSHSWLTTSEFESILNKYLELQSVWHKKRVEEHNKMVKEENIQPDSWAYAPPSSNDEPEYQVILASLKRFEELGYDARIVFWFDN